MIKLEPCPFCGNEKLTFATAAQMEECANFEVCEDCSMTVVLCSLSMNGCGTTSGYYATEEVAAAAWNKRITPSA